jgi:hypothetical protein
LFNEWNNQKEGIKNYVGWKMQNGEMNVVYTFKHNTVVINYKAQIDLSLLEVILR